MTIFADMEPGHRVRLFLRSGHLVVGDVIEFDRGEQVIRLTCRHPLPDGKAALYPYAVRGEAVDAVRNDTLKSEAEPL